MANYITIKYGNKVCQLPKSLVTNEEYMKEVVSASVWNNKLDRNDKVTLLRYLPNFPKNDTNEKKETLRKLFLGKKINFENQVNKFVSKVKDGHFNAANKSQRLINLILEERQSKINLLRTRLKDLKKIVENKQKMGLAITKDEENCLTEFANYLENDDPLAAKVDARFEKIFQETSDKNDNHKLTDLMTQYRNYTFEHGRDFDCLNMTEVTNRCRNEGDNKSNMEKIEGLFANRKRKQHNGFSEYEKVPRLQYDNGSSDSHSESSMGVGLNGSHSTRFQVKNELDEEDDNGEDDEEEEGSFAGDDSINSQSDADSTAGGMTRKKLVGSSTRRHERREFRCPQEEFPEFFSLLQRLFSGAHQRQLTCAQLEQRVRHWQTVSVARDGLCRRWALQKKEWATLVPSALGFLNSATPAVVEYRKKLQMWRWKKERTPTELGELFRDWKTNPNSLSNSVSGAGAGTNPVVLEDIPPPLNSTDWVCHASSLEERARFQAQERRRFQNPWRGFVYNVHGYDCVVGPIFTSVATASGSSGSASSSNSRARGHPLLLSDRPAHVTIVEIVRDAVARLPNGQGSRADIVTLASDSQYWVTSNATGTVSERAVAQCVSSALDRLQGESGGDPSVKYNARLKLWFYRHRHRTLAEMEANCVSTATPRHMSRITTSVTSAGPSAAPAPLPLSLGLHSRVHSTPTSGLYYQQRHPYMYSAAAAAAGRVGPTQQYSHQHHQMPYPSRLPFSGEMYPQHTYQQFSQAISNARELLQHQPPSQHQLSSRNATLLANRISASGSNTNPTLSTDSHHRIFVYNRSTSSAGVIQPTTEFYPGDVNTNIGISNNSANTNSKKINSSGVASNTQYYRHQSY